MNENAIVVRCEWLNTVLDIIHFFLQHSTIEYDGKKHTAKVKYHGPSGWKVSLDTTFGATIENTEFQEVVG